MRISIGLLIWICFGALNQAVATDWYVDSAASGTKTGTSWANAWTSWNGANGGINWASIAPGDTLYLSGGPAGGERVLPWGFMNVGKDGTASAPITIAIKADDPAHNGTLIFDLSAQGEQFTGYVFKPKNYVTFDGNVNGEQHLVIRNVAHYSDRNTANAFYAASPLTGFKLRYVKCYNVNNGVKFTSNTTKTDIGYSSFYVRGDAAIGISGGVFQYDDSSVHHNYIEIWQNGAKPPGQTGSYNGPDGIKPPKGMNIYNNVIRAIYNSEYYTSTQHPDSIQTTNSGWLKIYNNEFINIADAGITLEATASAYPINDVQIFNNVFRSEVFNPSYPESIRMFNHAGLPKYSNIKIINNTFVDHTSGNTQYIKIGAETNMATAAGTGNEIKNNIFYNVGATNSFILGFACPITWTSGGTTYNSTPSIWQVDGNIYYHAVPAANRISRCGTVSLGPAWVAANEPNGSTARPEFVSYTPLNRENDLRPSRAWAGGDLADVLLSIPELRLDKDGEERARGTAKAGAYRGPVGGVVPGAPAGLRASGQ